VGDEKELPKPMLDYKISGYSEGVLSHFAWCFLLQKTLQRRFFRHFKKNWLFQQIFFDPNILLLRLYKFYAMTGHSQTRRS
jgi:hypothetical protein